jgi:O-antigen polysaccharide polymerase Wzy
MNKSAICVYVLLGILIVSLELRRRAASKALDAMTVFNYYYFVLFVLVPINVICLGADVVRQQYAYERWGYGDEFTALAIFFSYVFFCFGYWVKSDKRGQSAASNGRSSYPLKASERVAKIIFLVGVLLTGIYVVQMGGILEVIRSASEVRLGELVIESKYIGYRFFSQFSADAFVLFFAVAIGKKVRKTNLAPRDKVFLLCAFVFFVYYALSTGGRRAFIYPIILCYLVYSSVGGRVKKVAVIAFALIFIIAGLGTILGPIVLSGNWATAFDVVDINRADWPGLFEVTYDNATQGLADSFIHFVGAQKASLWQFGFLTDIVNLPWDFFPSRLFGFVRSQHMYGETTEYFTGHALDESTSGAEPLGLHGYLLVNFGYVGMFAVFFLLGLFYKWLHIRYKPAETKDAVGWLVYWWVVLAFFVYFREGVIIFVIKTQLTWWMIVGLLAYYRTKQRGSLKSSAAIGSFGSVGTNQFNQT